MDASFILTSDILTDSYILTLRVNPLIIVRSKGGLEVGLWFCIECRMQKHVEKRKQALGRGACSRHHAGFAPCIILHLRMPRIQNTP